MDAITQLLKDLTEAHGVPARYIHSHSSIIHRQDYENAVKLLVALVSSLDAACVAGLTA
jgi:putative aminopeptidase FrvX